jgi:hypothetical protein
MADLPLEILCVILGSVSGNPIIIAAVAYGLLFFLDQTISVKRRLDKEELRDCKAK